MIGKIYSLLPDLKIGYIKSDQVKGYVQFYYKELPFEPEVGKEVTFEIAIRSGGSVHAVRCK